LCEFHLISSDEINEGGVRRPRFWWWQWWCGVGKAVMVRQWRGCCGGDAVMW